MNRRRFLATLCGVSSASGAWYSMRPPRRSIEIRYWLSTRAAEYDVHERIPEYVETALTPIYDAIDISFGGTVSVRTEHGYGVTRSGEWPRRVLTGNGRSDGVDPVEDVNLLVTDGSMQRAPTGVALYTLASVGGARYLENVPARAAVDDVVAYEPSVRVMQILLHEIGHVLGLDHEHGSIKTVSDRTVASPMVSTYAWTDPRGKFTADRCACGNLYPETSDGNRYLSLDFSACAREELRTYRGRFFP